MLSRIQELTLLIAAGNDTTRYATASAVHVLANRPSLFEQLRGADGKLWSTAVEELLRTSSPIVISWDRRVLDFV